MVRNLLVLVTIFFSFCNSKYDSITKYYQENKKLHIEMASNLLTFCRDNQTDIIIRKQYDGSIFFSCNFP
jgi:hypothetical protein